MVLIGRRKYDNIFQKSVSRRKDMPSRRKFWSQYKETIKRNKGTFFVYVFLRALVVIAMVVSCARGNYENLFFCGLALVLFLVPSFLERKLRIDVPNVLEVIVLLFIFASIIMGEMGNYYTKVPIWDTALHTVNGFLCAAVGFGLTDILNRNENVKFRLSPLFLSLVAFCFSMTIGVLWEFFEFACDTFLGKDMQKDFVVQTIVSTFLSGETKAPEVIRGIDEVIINGENLGIDGYLDIGLFDTMKDLLVNFLGAAVFSVMGFFYVKYRGKGKLVENFIPRAMRKNDEE